MASRIARAALVAVASVLLVAPPLGAQRREVQPVERVAAITRPAIVYLEVYWAGWLRDERDGKLWMEDAVETGATCSGSLVTPDGYVLTAGHCVEAELVVPELVQGVVDAYVANGDVAEEDAQSFYDEVAENSVAEGEGDAGAELGPEITVYRGIVDKKGERDGDSYEAEIVDMLSFLHSKGDTALLKLKGAKGLPTIQMSDETDIGVGTPIVAIGYPGSVSRIIDPTLEPTFKDGTVSARRTQAGVPFYEVSAASSPGMSGGPVVDLDSKVIGVVSQAPADESQSFNLMASASIARDLMRKNRVTPRLGPTDETYRRGLEQLFEGEFRDSVESFDSVLKADPKHQQAFEIRAEAAKRVAAGDDDSGGLPPLALIPALIGAAGIGYTALRRRRKPAEAVAAPAVAPMGTAPPVTPVPVVAGDPLTCARCGNVHARQVTFCTKCGAPMTAGAPAPVGAPPSTPAPAPAPTTARSARDKLILAGSVGAVVLAALVFFLSRGSDDGRVLPTVAPTATSAPRAEGPSIAGQWASTFGPVTLTHDEISGDGAVDVTGSWIQGVDKEGEITSGTFDPEEGTLEISYVETWSGTEGTASFVLSEDGNTLEGSYEQPDARGEWVFTR